MAAYDLVFIESGRQDSNLRPSAPKAQVMFFKRFVRTIAIIEYLYNPGSFLRHKKWFRYLIFIRNTFLYA